MKFLILQTYNDLSKQILFNGTVVTCTFFAISSFLMAYNFEIHREKHKVTWVSWPKGILYRWLRFVFLLIKIDLIRSASITPRDDKKLVVCKLGLRTIVLCDDIIKKH